LSLTSLVNNEVLLKTYFCLNHVVISVSPPYVKKIKKLLYRGNIIQHKRVEQKVRIKDIEKYTIMTF